MTPTILDASTILIVTIEILDFWGSLKVYHAPTILIVTIEIFDFWGYWRFFQQIF